MSIINRVLNRFAAWALARSTDIDPDPGVKSKTPSIWGYTIADYLDGGPYLTRILFPRVLGFRPMLHKFHRPDGDRAIHNHPWRWSMSLVFRGSYTEERKLDDEEINGTRAPRTQLRLVRWFNVLRDTDFHRVTELHGEEVWTLFITGPRVQSWGFLEDGTFTEWREYIDAKKATHAAALEHAKAEDAENEATRKLIRDLRTLTGDALDSAGESMLETKRFVSYKMHGTLSVVDHVEPDAEYRARLLRVLYGE